VRSQSLSAASSLEANEQTVVFIATKPIDSFDDGQAGFAFEIKTHGANMREHLFHKTLIRSTSLRQPRRTRAYQRRRLHVVSRSSPSRHDRE
jgi:hypothetical protein